MEPHKGDAELVPVGLRAAAGWTWRMVVLGLGLYLLLRLMDTFKVLLVPVLVALLLVALLRPVVDLMTARTASAGRPARGGLPRAAASLAAMLLALAVVAGLVTLIGQQISTGFGDLQTQAVGGWHELQRQLAASPLHLTSEQIGQFVDQAAAGIQGNGNRVVTGAVQVGSTAADIGTGFFIVLFSTYFFLSGGDRIWAWVVRLFPRTARQRVDGAGVRAWSTLTSYVRATVVVALVDGIGVGVVASILRVPLAIPLGVLVFLGAFVPVVGALVSGIVAVLVALVAEGPVVALLMLAGVVAVQQIEAHVLQPFLMGRAVSVHPLAVILSIGAGVLLAGIVGGLFAVPLAAVVNVVAQYLSHDSPEPESDEGVLADQPAPVDDA
ncbi:MAG TPA: AI-2E family transporter, partial [Kineosporiaceae bacterium]|nr:AI-2E family transporter [Kineosporiaceae bacterium]